MNARTDVCSGGNRSGRDALKRRRYPAFWAQLERQAIASCQQVAENLGGFVQASIQLRDIFEALGDGVFVADAQGRYLEVNPAGCRMLGYTLEEFRTLTLVDVVDPGELARLDAVVAEMADMQIHRSEWLFRRKDGSTFVGELVGGQLPDGRLQSIVRDVTERRAREEFERTLRREAAHRTKNVLAVVQAILKQSQRSRPDDFVGGFEERMRGLALSHDLFVRGEWAQVDLVDLVTAQMQPFGGTAGTQIAIQGPSVSMGPAAAQALGLALHELGTNAVKYGALSVDTGRVDIAWRIEDGAKGPELRMTWREIGGPGVAAPERTGFGSALIGKLTQRSLRGETCMSFAPTGVEWSLTCELAHLVEG